MTLLADSLFSEAYRFSRNRMTVFWSVFFVPILFAAGGLAYHLITKTKADKMAAEVGIPLSMGHTPVNLAEALNLAATRGANGAILVFVLIGAATLYAGDYRWETWRLISARNSRLNLLLGKVGVLKLLALAAMFVFLIAAFVYSLSQAVVFARPVTFEFEGIDAGRLILFWLLSWVRIVQYAMLALLTATVTRSLLASLFVPLVVGFAQAVFGSLGLSILGWNPQDWAPQLLLPGLAYDSLKAVIAHAPGAPPIPEGAVLKGLVSLALWTFVPLFAAIAWFQRQDFSKE
jgi:ABC-2 type transport system permease protein